MLLGSEPVNTREGNTEADILKQIRERAALASDGWRHNFKAAREDVTFLAGDQWPEKVRKERVDEARPMLTLNKLPQYVDQVIGDQRQNRPAIHIHPVEADNIESVDKVANLAGNQDYSQSEVYESLIRNIEYTSNAEAHYDTAFQHAVEGGFGWLRAITQYSSDDAFDQDICIKSIRNRFAVLADPYAVEPDLSDMNFCFISEMMDNKEFDKRYPGKPRGDLGDAEDDLMSWWISEGQTRVAEYFRREPVIRTLMLLSDGKVVWEDEIKAVIDELAGLNVTVIRERKVKTYKVKWMKVTAYSILEKEVDWPGSTIPVVPVLGKEITLGDRTYYRGLIRYAKDAQRMHNFWMTAATERIALAPKAPYIGPAEAFEGHEAKWKEANRSNWAFLPYNELPSGDRPRREMPPPMPAAELQIAMSATDEIKATIGLYDASMGAQGNEQSGKAIIARQRQGDRGTFAYIDNLSRAIRRIGQICIEVIPKIYDSERVVRMRFENGKGDWIKINETIIDEETNEPVLINDMALGKFDVTVSAGPSYQTQRLEAADSLMQFAQAVPAAASLLSDLIAKNMDWPGADEISKRLQKTLPPGILSPEEQEAAGVSTEPPPPTPEQQAAMAQAEADIAKAQADTAMAEAKTMEAQAKITEIEQAASVAGPGTIQETVRNLVADALAELMSQSGANA
ncbi:MAG: hypothetical protein KAT62_03670 [Desulfuromonadales bacterium]|nr:hypothetical protein [Desulfuromonadales bacterium]